MSLGALGVASAALLSDWLAPCWQEWIGALPPWSRFTAVVFAIHGVVFWGMTAFFAWADRRGDDSWIAKYRIQTDTSRRPPRSKVARNLLINQLVLSPVMLCLIWGALELRGWPEPQALPTVTRQLVMMAGLTVISALYFYASHRFLHRPWWMKRVHRVHHEFKSTTPVAAEYAHWFEFIFGNFGTMAVGVILLAPSLWTIYLYTALGTYTFVAHHSGYALPWITSPVHHDWHHFRYIEAFGTFGHLDRWLGTSREFDGLKPDQEVQR